MTPQYDAQFGVAARNIFAHQVENPEAYKNTDVPMGVSAIQALSGYGQYQGSFAGKSGSSPTPAPQVSSSRGSEDDSWAYSAPPAGPSGVSPSYTGASGTFYQGVAGGVVNTRNGQFSPDVGPGFVNSTNGQVMPKP